MNSLFDMLGIRGPGTGAQPGYNPAQQVTNRAAAYNSLQQMAASYSSKQYMIRGKSMDLIEFVETLYPEDCPERTFLLLKLKEEN